MQHKDETINYDFIRTLEIEDVLLIESNHKANSLYTHGTKLELDITKPEGTKIIVQEQFIVFEVSIQVQVFRQDTDQDEERVPMLESMSKFGAIYRYENLDGWDNDAISDFSATFFRFSAITHILAFAREHFFMQMIKSGYPRLHIPLIKSLLDEDGENAASENYKTIAKK